MGRVRLWSIVVLVVVVAAAIYLIAAYFSLRENAR
jgi:hypothetical protein